MVLNLKAVLNTLGILVFFLGVALLLPMLVGIYYGESAWRAFAVTALAAIALGGATWRGLDFDVNDLRVREGFAIVATAWLVLSCIGAVPFILSGALESYTDAFFETMSGFTTTGATILGGTDTPDIESMPRSMLFWRSLAHWLGGMGIIVLTLAIMPILGVGGMQMFKAEVPGPTADKLTPRVRETAKRLWLIYVGITAFEVVALLPAMGGFDAINHAFATMATGGFSTKNGSVGQFQSAYIDWVITFFMFLAGINFALHYRLIRGEPMALLRNTQLRVYTGIVVVSTLVIAASVWTPAVPEELAFDGYSDVLDALRYGAFQATAIITTTGFATADYEIWPTLAVGVIFGLFFVGGMAGSTGGGMKVVRHVLLFKNSYREIRHLIHPQAILPLRMSGKVVSQDVLNNVLSFAVLYLAAIVFGCIVLSLMGVDLLTALGAAISSVGNVGPAFGTLGPAENYAHLPVAGKWFLSFLMMAGRLELFTVLILFAPSFWRR